MSLLGAVDKKALEKTTEKQEKNTAHEKIIEASKESEKEGSHRQSSMSESLNRRAAVKSRVICKLTPIF